jgi:hypothetical protein
MGGLWSAGPGNRGDFVAALRHLRRGHELGSKNPRWSYPSAQWVKQCERLVELDAMLPKVLLGEVEPAGVGERLALAQICQRHKSLYAAACRFYAAAFAIQPQLAKDLRVPHRYNAACAAALAGCGQGQDAAGLGEKERARLRQQACDWLLADLAAWRTLLEKQRDIIRPVVIQKMRHWLQDDAFTGVRGEKALAELPAAEPRSWRKLWDAVADTLTRAQGKAALDTKSDRK